MTETVTVAIIASAGGVLTAALGVVIGVLTKLNSRLRRWEHRDRLSWLYIRSLIDHAYRHGAVPLPEPPEGWLEDGDEQ